MLITHEMTARHFESRSLDLLERMPAEERMRLALYLRLTGYAGNDRDRLNEARDIEAGARAEQAAVASEQNLAA